MCVCVCMHTCSSTLCTLAIQRHKNKHACSCLTDEHRRICHFPPLRLFDCPSGQATAYCHRETRASIKATTAKRAVFHLWCCLDWMNLSFLLCCCCCSCFAWAQRCITLMIILMFFRFVPWNSERDSPNYLMFAAGGKCVFAEANRWIKM